MSKPNPQDRAMANRIWLQQETRTTKHNLEEDYIAHIIADTRPKPSSVMPNPKLQDAYDYLVRITKAYLETVPAQQGGGNQVTQRQVLADAVYLFQHKTPAPKLEGYVEVTLKEIKQASLGKIKGKDVFINLDTHNLLSRCADTIEALSAKLAKVEAQMAEAREKMLAIVEDNERLEALAAGFWGNE